MRYLVWHQRTSTWESQDILCGKFHECPNWPQDCRGPPPAPRASAAPTKNHARIVVIYPVECDHIYVNRIISHKVIVSEYITLQTLHRRFRLGTPMCWSDFNDVITSKTINSSLLPTVSTSKSGNYDDESTLP